MVVSLSMSVALLLGSGQMFAQQAAVSAALVATLQPPDGGVEFARSLDALVGGSVALVVSALVLPAHPGRMVRAAAAPVLAELAGVLEDIAAALETRDREARPGRAARGREIDELARNLDDALVVGRETALLAPPRRRTLGTVDLYADAAAQIDLAVRNVRVLARGARRAIELEENVPPEVADALRELAAAVRALAAALDDPAQADAVRGPALRAAGKATLVLERTGNLSVSVIVGQIRSTAVDLLRGVGMSYEDAVDAVRAAVREAEDARGRGRRLTRPRQPGWHSGHQYVVRPPIVARAIPVPQRGQAPSRRALGDHVARVHAAAADRRAGRGAQLAAQPVELLRSARPPVAAATAGRARASRPPAGCRPRRARPGRAAAP